MEGKHSEHFLSLIVPVYKQEKTIVSNLKQIVAVLDDIRYDYEIIVVIDGIVDKSYKKIKATRLPKVKSITYMKNQGKAWALRLGLAKAKGDYVMFIDSGLEIDPNGISMLLEHMEWYNADIIVGSKRHPASQITYSSARKILSYGYYILVKLLFGLKVRDTQAGIKVFRKRVLETILPRLVDKKFTGDLEMLIAAQSLGYTRIYEAPIKIDFTLSPLTSAATRDAIIGIFMDTMALFYRKNILHYYEKSSRKHIKKNV